MTGSEKQVAWAEQIKSTKMREIAPWLDSMAARLSAKPAELAKVDALRATLDPKDAGWWIDRRDVFGLDIARAAAAGK